MIECAKCGSQNHFEGAMFCRGCGAELPSRVTVAVAETPVSRQEEDELLPRQMGRRDKQLGTSFSDENDDVPRREVHQGGGLEIEPVTGSSSGIDQLLNHYGRTQMASPDDNLTEPAVSPTQELGVESPTDFLLRQHDISSEITAREASKEGKTTRPSSPAAVTSTLPASEKDKLLQSLEKETGMQTHEVGNPVDFQKEDLELTPAGEVEQSPAPLVLRPPSEAATAPQQSVVYVRGSKLLFPGRPRLQVGDTIAVGNQKYTVRKGSIDKKSWMLAAVFALVLVTILIIQNLSTSSPLKPVVFGVATNAETKEALAGVAVSIPQTGAFTVTDESGAFKFVGLADGYYDLKFEGGLYENLSLPMTMKDGQSEVLHASLRPLIPKSSSITSAMPQTGAEGVINAGPLYGGLKINCSVADANVLIDGKALGTVAQTFKKLMPGTHTLEVSRDGYQIYTQSVKVEEGETTTLTVELTPTEAKPAEYTAEDFYRQGEALFTEGKHTEAVAFYTLALAKDNTMVQAYVRRAEANMVLGKDTNARADYRSAADLYLHSSQFASAVECYDKIIEISPNAADAYQLRGWAKISSGNYEGVKDLEKALSFNKEDVQSQFELGKALYITGNYKESEKVLKKIRKFGDDRPEIHGYLALAYLGQGNDSEARKSYEAFQKRANSTQVARMSTESGWQRLTALAGR